MIIEGKHSEAGTGVFVSDLQPGSCAEAAGLVRGDMILSVNGEDFVGVSYSTAARVLKNAEGTVKMIVANPNANPTIKTFSPPPSPPLPSPPPPPPLDVEPLPASQASSEPVSEASSKPKLPPKPAIAPKPATLSPAHKAVSPTQTSPSAPFPIPLSATSTSPSSADSTKTAASKKPVASPRKKDGSNVAHNPATCEIIPGSRSTPLHKMQIYFSIRFVFHLMFLLLGADTIIEITKDKNEDGKPMGLGLSIVGGSDTLLGAIFIHDVYEKGAAHKDGRLQPGDQVRFCKRQIK